MPNTCSLQEQVSSSARRQARFDLREIRSERGIELRGQSPDHLGHVAPGAGSAMSRVAQLSIVVRAPPSTASIR